MNDDQYFLANAYLDGELTADERAIAEADADVMAEVDRLGALRAELRDVEPPSNDARERAFTAALGEFDALHGGAEMAAVTHRAPPPPSRQRPAYAKYLGAAAAVVAVGLLGVVVINSAGGGDHDDAGADMADTMDAATEMTQLAGADAADDFTDRDLAESAPTADAEEMDGSEDAATADEMAEASADMAEDSADMAADAERADDDAGADDATAAVATSPPQYVPGMLLVTPRDLLAYGLHLLVQRDEQQLPPTPNSKCAFPDLEAHTVEILDETVIVIEGEERLMLIAVDTEDGKAFALDPDTCEIAVESTEP